MNEKLDIKSEFEGEIPAPAAAAPPRLQRGPSMQRRLTGIFLKLSVFALFMVTMHRRTETNIANELDQHEGRWVARVFSDSWSWSRRKVLYGKKAEEAFL